MEMYEDTIEERKNLFKSLTHEKRKKWYDILAGMDMKRNSKKAWNLIKWLNNNPK